MQIKTDQMHDEGPESAK